MGLNRFHDEWIVPAALKLPGVSVDEVDRLRGQGRTFLSQALVDDGLATVSQIGRAVAETLRLEYADISSEGIDKIAVSLVPERVCRRHQLIPFSIKDELIFVAMANPVDMQARDDVQAASGRKPVAHYLPPHCVARFLNEFFSPEVVINDLLHRAEEGGLPVEIVEDSGEKGKDAAVDAGVPQAARMPVTRLVNAVIAKAVGMRASDIHIEHEESLTVVRYRIDGILKNIMTLPRSIGNGLFVSRIKVMADLDIANHRTPQDGRANIRVGPVEMALRVSVLPAQFGETVVIRILDPRTAQLTLDKLGLHAALVAKLEWVVGSAQGMLLITGPTGSGKTTTIYALLNELKKSGNNIVTVEDPVEYRLEGLNQVQVKEKQGLSFSSVLRSILRQDPDVIMVGEVRDRKTADISFQAALTGHLVLTSLHTNTVFSAVARLMDMGVERFKIGPALLGVVAQRLVRRLCPACREPVPPAECSKAVVEALTQAKLEPRYFRARGCAKCGQSGYTDRIPLFEYLDFNQALRDRLAAGADESALRRCAEEQAALRTLLTDALWRLSRGDTSLDELMPHVSFDAPPAARPQPRPEERPAMFEAPTRAAAVERVTQDPVNAVIPAADVGSRRILIADDDPAATIILSQILTDAGHRVITARNGAEALEKINRDPPDLVITDINMPQLDGYGVIRGLRQILGLVSMPVIVISANSDEKSQEKALVLGGDDFIIKPYKPHLVIARVNALFRRIQVR